MKNYSTLLAQKVLLTIVAILLFSIQLLPGQDCLPDKTIFSSQTQIDSFALLYPNCTSIIGSIEIRESESGSITDLKAFSKINFVGESLTIWRNDSLKSLSGLENLKSIGGDLRIFFNHSLTTLAGLDDLSLIGNNLQIRINYNLINFTGLSNLLSIGGGLDIGYNQNLVSIHDLRSLKTLEGSLVISNNESLLHLYGLEGITQIKNAVLITKNLSLTDLKGLDSLQRIDNSLTINGNPSLKSLSGLNRLDSISHELVIHDNQTLPNLVGLDNLKKVGLYLKISNDSSLVNLSGLENLSEIGANLLIDFNPRLTDLHALSGLKTINNAILDITDNDALESLSGIDNVDPASISKLSIRDCQKLNYCELSNICRFLEDKNNPTDIYLNADNCKSRMKIEEACILVFTGEQENYPLIRAFPNPVGDNLTIESDRDIHLTVLNMIGQRVNGFNIQKGINYIFLGDLPMGIYFLSGNGISIKFIIQY